MAGRAAGRGAGGRREEGRVAGRQRWLLCVRIGRGWRTGRTSFPSARAPRTSGQKAGVISGAPPVISTVSTSGEAASTRRMCSTSRSSIASVRRGDDSTWQCVQAWLQSSPTLSCSIVTASLRSGRETPCCPRNAAKSGTPSASRARRLRLRSCSERRCFPIARSSAAFCWNSEPALSISASVSGTRLPRGSASGCVPSHRVPREQPASAAGVAALKQPRRVAGGSAVFAARIEVTWPRPRESDRQQVFFIFR